MKKPLDQTFKQLENLELKPSAKAWERIQAEIGEDKRRRFGAWYGVAAAAALFITAYSGYQYLQQGTNIVVPTNVVTTPVNVMPNTPANENIKVLETPQPGIINHNNETMAVRKTTTGDRFAPKIEQKSVPMQAQITVNQEFVQTQTPSKMVNTVNVGDTNAEIMKENEQLDAFANIPSLPFSNLNVMNDVALCALPEVAMLSKNESILANMNTKMANSTCREVANDATLSERLLAFADCKTRALIKKVDTNIVNEYKQLRGY